MENTESRVWFITGCSTGFGRELAKAVLARGERVVATARKVEEVQDFEESGPELARAVRLDVTDPEEVSGAVDAALDAFGRIDVLVNNAGGVRDRTLLKMSDAEFDDCLLYTSDAADE